MEGTKINFRPHCRPSFLSSTAVCLVSYYSYVVVKIRPYLYIACLGVILSLWKLDHLVSCRSNALLIPVYSFMY